jgi:aspartate oxidase
MYVCTDQPANYAGIAAVALVGPITLTPGAGNGDFTLADGDVSGRKLTVAAQSGTASASGDADHIVLATGGATDLLRYVTTNTLQTVTSGNQVNVGAWDIEFRDPT